MHKSFTSHLGLVACLTMFGQQATAFSLPVLQPVYSAQKVHDGRPRPLTDVLDELKQRYSVDILYGDKLVRGLTVPNGVLEEGADLEKNLKIALKDTGLQFRKFKDKAYLITGKRIEKGPTPSAKMNLEPSNVHSATTSEAPMPDYTLSLPSTAAPVGASVDHSVNGQVTDENGEGMPGVNIIIKGTTRGAATDEKGRFALILPEGNNITLIFSLVGYISQEVLVNTRTSLDVRLLPDSKNLEELVVIGYGSQKKRDVTGAISSVKAEDLQLSASSNFLQALQGKATGIQVLQTTGQPGADVSIKKKYGVTPPMLIQVHYT